jgi:hypothetical protein
VLAKSYITVRWNFGVSLLSTTSIKMALTRSRSKGSIPLPKVELILEELNARIRQLEEENSELLDLNEVFIDDASKFQLRCESAERRNIATTISTQPSDNAANRAL